MVQCLHFLIPQNYFRFNFSQSALSEYNSKAINRIMIEEGDEIRVTYARPIIETPGIYYDNSSAQKKIVNKTFQVLGYELAPPEVIFGSGYDGPGGANDGWGLTSPGETFFANATGLPEKGIFSADSLKGRYDLMAQNSQSLYAYFALSVGNIADMWTGSVVSTEVLFRAGQPDPTNPSVICPTGSIKVKWKTGQNGTGGSGTPINNPSKVNVAATQFSQRNSGNGKPPSGFSYNATTGDFTYNRYQQVYLSTKFKSFDAGFMYDTLKVTPDPSKFPLDEQIISGSIMSATLVKRVNDDTKVVLNLNQPLNQKGVLTPSGDGYLVPDDLTSTQLDNVQKIINVLKSQNSFTNPPDANETNDVS